jgi:hypothetical protein
MFKEFRKMLNTVKPKKAVELLDDMEDWDEAHREEIEILRKDVKNWYPDKDVQKFLEQPEGKDSLDKLGKAKT